MSSKRAQKVNTYLDIEVIVNNEEEEEEEEEELAKLLADVQCTQQARVRLDNACVGNDAAEAEPMAWSITERDMAARCA
ncbi:hypothetical protein SCP_0903570 [Sparassis crispa]|uniref:Uncharacterized protein n=1 Tax=Sparassis crispa TaxID=139825 RepID=A0A401GW74_9APHY|nr:hypothetical protein SCP_0903570 [Sparassis crispa]GBE86478.1 hypothetical protein SCP_0903570 [Sparassis crispa]